MSREIIHVDTQHHASWKNKIKKGAANIVAGGLATASIAVIGCKNIETTNPVETPSPTPAVSEHQTPTSTQELIGRQTVDQLRQQKNAIYSEIMDKMEAGVDKEGQQYFLGFNDVYGRADEDSRILLPRERILDKSGIPTWILITHAGPRSLRVENPDDIEVVEKFIKRNLEQAGKEAKYRRQNASPSGVSSDVMRIGPIIGGKLFEFDSLEPTNDMIKEAIEESQRRARESIEIKTKLENAEKLRESFDPLINPQQK